MASVDGRIDCAMTEQIDPSNAYYDALEQLDCLTTIEGRVTKQIHYALAEPFVATLPEPVGRTAFRKAAVFDGIDEPNRPATLLKLQTVERMGDTVWMRYKV